MIAPSEIMLNIRLVFASLCFGYLLLISRLIFAPESSFAHPDLRFLLLTILVNLLVENSILTFTRVLYKRNFLLIFSKVRYLMHAIVTPILLPMSLYFFDITDIKMLGSLKVIAWAVALAWSLLSVKVTFFNLKLKLVSSNNILRYKNVDSSGQPLFRIALVLLILVYFWIGIIKSTNNGLYLIVGSVSMLLGNAVAAKHGLYLSNLGEFIFISTLIIYTFS